ncbi:MAG: hypothetical protein ACI93R_001350 [Flavobacteriales bacterium]|jgi:hypothetical protein
MDPVSATFTTFGVVTLLSSWVYLLILSFREDFNWGLTTLFAPPASYLYALFALDKAGSAISLAMIGCVLIFIGW